MGNLAGQGAICAQVVQHENFVVQRDNNKLDRSNSEGNRSDGSTALRVENPELLLFRENQHYEPTQPCRCRCLLVRQVEPQHQPYRYRFADPSRTDDGFPSVWFRQQNLIPETAVPVTEQYLIPR